MSGADPGLLEAVPNVATCERAVIDGVGRALRANGCDALDVHSDPDYQRTVFTLAGRPQELADALMGAIGEVVAGVDMRSYEGAHPCVGALDVLPIVYLDPRDRNLAVDEALGLANRIGSEVGVPVFLYGELAATEERRERSYFRSDGTAGLAARLEQHELKPDFGPARLHPTAGATLVGVRPPLVAFNIELSDASLELARSIGASIREQDGGLPGVRALGLQLEQRGVMQVSVNVHDPLTVPLADVVAAVRVLADAGGAGIAGAELVGLAPAAALEGLDTDLLRDFDADRHVLENRINRG